MYTGGAQSGKGGYSHLNISNDELSRLITDFQNTLEQYQAEYQRAIALFEEVVIQNKGYTAQEMALIREPLDEAIRNLQQHIEFYIEFLKLILRDKESLDVDESSEINKEGESLDSAQQAMPNLGGGQSGGGGTPSGGGGQQPKPQQAPKPQSSRPSQSQSPRPSMPNSVRQPMPARPSYRPSTPSSRPASPSPAPRPSTPSSSGGSTPRPTPTRMSTPSMPRPSVRPSTDDVQSLQSLEEGTAMLGDSYEGGEFDLGALGSDMGDTLRAGDKDHTAARMGALGGAMLGTGAIAAGVARNKRNQVDEELSFDESELDDFSNLYDQPDAEFENFDNISWEQ